MTLLNKTISTASVMQWLNKVLGNVGTDSVARIVFGHLPV